MVFKRRTPRTYFESMRNALYPKGGIRRAVRYALHRMRRLPDPPHRIARGVFVGTFVNFPPLYGVQVLSALGLTWLMRGNYLAAVLFTFLSNPITTPFIAMLSIELGHWMLGIEAPLDFVTVYAAFTEAGAQLWFNFTALFTEDQAHWDKLEGFFWFIFWPYLIGSIIPGLIAAGIAYYLALPAVHAYQKLRKKRLRDRSEKLRAHAAARLRAASAKAGDDEGGQKP
jgi:uncharacterized protein (DUF2062 family)